MLGKLRLSILLLVVGAILTVVGFGAYAVGNSTLNLVGFFYGIPVLLGGAALKAAELKPVPFKTPPTPEVVALRQTQATATLNQIRKDVTRYRYGQEAHLDVALERLGLSPTDEQRPVLAAIAEEAIAGAYALVLEFESPFIPFETWQGKRDKFERFFGPQVCAAVEDLGGDRVALTLTVQTAAAAATTPTAA